MNLGTQYYRPPFPVDSYWEDDLIKMADSGLNTVQLWVLWAWVESTPGSFVFDDYDKLVQTADKNGLNVVLSTIGEIQPYWIHREVPGSEMITNMGHKVVSSNRGECHFGLTPGGCTDHPGVWERMSAFIEAVGKQYASAPNLVGWDAWNELRWDVQADGLVCYCDHTVTAFRKWLEQKHGSLDGLNKAWNRRYSCWEDVVPGKTFNRPYTEMMAFAHFLTMRSCKHSADRYKILKGVDPNHPVTVHGGQPSPEQAAGPESTALNRGNDWYHAENCDGVGCSSFPVWQGIDDAGFGVRVEFVHSASRGKEVWLSELQGGRSAIGFNVYDPVPALRQQRWIWNGIACGADTILHWCWRDEVFGRESAGFGITGRDGLADERVEALRHTGSVLKKHMREIDAYDPDRPEVGVLFSPQTYYVHWAQDGGGWKAKDALNACCRGLTRSSIPYLVVEEEHLDELEGLKVLFMPRILALSSEAEQKLETFAENGGTIVCESETGAFSDAGIYRYPEERFIYRSAGLLEVGRRSIEKDVLTADLPNGKTELCTEQWLTPVSGADNTYAAHGDGALVCEARAGKGRIIYTGTYPANGYGYNGGDGSGYETFLKWCCDSSGATPPVRVQEPSLTKDSFIYTRFGTTTDDRRVLFVFFQEGTEKTVLEMDKHFSSTPGFTDIISGEKHTASESDESMKLELPCPEWKFAVLIED